MDQFKLPMNYVEPMNTSFADANCFIYNKLDIAEDTAKKTFQFRKLLLPKNNKGHVGHVEDNDDSPGTPLPAHKGALQQIAIAVWSTYEC